jgi:ubiquinone/menaquinone biosynthesis C-methylase UbiE
MPRLVTGELLDRPDASEAELRETFRFIRGVNRWLGGAGALLRHLRAWSARWPRDRPVTLLDLGTGCADIPLAARRWAVNQGLDLRITATDAHPLALRLAKEAVGDEPGVTVERLDALRLRERFAADQFDYVHAGMMLHHLKDIEVLTVLASMDRVARAGIVWNDLQRSGLALAVVSLATARAHPTVKHDARASIRAAFTRTEVLDFAARSGITYCQYGGSVIQNRFTLAGEKPGAWR